MSFLGDIRERRRETAKQVKAATAKAKEEARHAARLNRKAHKAEVKAAKRDQKHQHKLELKEAAGRVRSEHARAAGCNAFDLVLRAVHDDPRHAVLLPQERKQALFSREPFGHGKNCSVSRRGPEPVFLEHGLSPLCRRLRL